MSFNLFSNQLYLHAITTFTFILLLLITSRIVFILIIIILFWLRQMWGWGMSKNYVWRGGYEKNLPL